VQTPSANLVSSILIGATIFAGLVRASTSRPFHVAGPASVALAHQLYGEAVEREPGERQEAARRFRGSPWSQDDDFHSKEMKHVKGTAKSKDVSITSLLDALDQGMHQGWPTEAKNLPNPKVMPCRPRLSY
jgi:hypothetical protein